MLQESKCILVLCLAIFLAACAAEETGEGGLGTETDTTEEVGDNADADTTETEVEDDSDESTDDAGTQTDDESTDDAGTQTDDESTDDAGTQTDDESTNDAGTQTDDESTNDAGTQTDDESTDDASGDADAETDTTDGTTPSDADDPEDEYTGHDLNGKWEGSYTCSQGFTRLTLQVSHSFESHELDTVFAFYADNSNPDVPTGRYSMTGSYDPDSGNVDLNEDAWIEQPTGYVMVSLDGFINEEGTSITGTVDNFGCTEFTVVRGN